MRLGFECRLDYTATCVPWFEEQVAVAHPVPFTEVLTQVLRNGGMMSGIQGGLGILSGANQAASSASRSLPTSAMYTPLRTGVVGAMKSATGHARPAGGEPE